MKKIAVFHYNPLELFPPAMNLINYMAAESGPDIAIRVYSISAGSKFKKFSSSPASNVKIKRPKSFFYRKIKLLRFVNYVWHYLSTLVDCLFWRPKKIIYIESYSSVVPFLLKKYFIRNVEIYIHYHEYLSPEEYRKSPLLNKIHTWEKNIYKEALWISHTNVTRVELFLNDLNHIGLLDIKVMPNYPPQSWVTKIQSKNPDDNVIKIVYIGAIDLETMYIVEVVNWINKQHFKCVFDIYSNQETDDLAIYLQKNGNNNIQVKGSVGYFELPGILQKYHVGIILYKPTTLNLIHLAPNKLFEYLVCNLDVLFPDSLLGTVPYQRNNVYPKIISLDFTNLEKYNIKELIEKKELKYIPNEYTFEKAWQELVQRLLN